MASTYTSNTGIEKIGSGEQAGTWGTTTNTNFDIIDDALNGVLTLTISGNTTLTTDDGTVSNGHHKVLLLTGTPSGAFNLTINPNDQQKWYFVSNNTGQTATILQGGGSGTTVSMATGTSAIVYADGTGSNANVARLDPTILDDAVTTAKIANSNVTTAKIANSNITLAKMAANSIDSNQYVNGSIDAVHLATDSVTTAKIVDSNVTTAKIADSNVTTAKISNSNVTTAKIADNAITTAKIADDAITSATIANDAVALGTQTTGNYVATITAGTGISGSSSSEGGTPTIALATAGAGAATYGSTDDGTKIDTITLDAYGRITAVATGSTGTLSNVGSVGKVLQVLQDTATSQTGISASSKTSFGLSQAITTASSSNKVLVQANIAVDFEAYRTSGDNDQVAASKTNFFLFRGGSQIAVVGTVGQGLSDTQSIRVMCPILYLDSPGSAATHTYEIKAQTNQTSDVVVNINTASDSGSFLVLQEISS
jgi:hypothetical protein